MGRDITVQESNKKLFRRQSFEEEEEEEYQEIGPQVQQRLVLSWWREQLGYRNLWCSAVSDTHTILIGIITLFRYPFSKICFWFFLLSLFHYENISLLTTVASSFSSQTACGRRKSCRHKTIRWFALSLGEDSRTMGQLWYFRIRDWPCRLQM